MKDDHCKRCGLNHRFYWQDAMCEDATTISLLRDQIRNLRGCLEGFRHEAQNAIDHRHAMATGGMLAGTPGWVLVPQSTCLAVIRDCNHALGANP